MLEGLYLTERRYLYEVVHFLKMKRMTWQQRVSNELLSDVVLKREGSARDHGVPFIHRSCLSTRLS